MQYERQALVGLQGFQYDSQCGADRVGGERFGLRGRGGVVCQHDDRVWEAP